ncbi:MAG TPA: hypothetical protein VLI65_09465 [Pyrinomonadaceae bacterium]|nr:hypothetical protein [Pyrinomonadaceae bacterium]
MRRRGKHLLLSPIDWAMIEGWQDRGIPLHIVIRGIETVFDAFDKKPSNRSIKGLLYCREEIEAQYAEWLASQAGGNGSEAPAGHTQFERISVAAHIDEAIRVLQELKNEALAEDFQRACTRLAELRENLSDDFETVDKSLCDIENFLENALLAHSGPDHRAAAEKEIAAQLKAYKSTMEPDVYKKTFDLMLTKRLREDAGIPRLGLFYL